MWVEDGEFTPLKGKSKCEAAICNWVGLPHYLSTKKYIYIDQRLKGLK